MRCLIQRIERDQSLCMLNGCFRLFQRTVVCDEHSEGLGKLVLQFFRFGNSPFIENRRVLEAEAGQEVVAIKINGIK